MWPSAPLGSGNAVWVPHGMPLRGAIIPEGAKMGNRCERLLALTIFYKASKTAANPAAFADGKLDAPKCILGVEWTTTISQAAADRKSGLRRRGLSDPSTAQLAR